MKVKKWTLVGIVGVFLSGCTCKPVEHTCRIGAEEGDATQRIQQAIDAAFTAGGGTVRLGAGTHAVKSLRVRSRVTLYLEKGAMILGSRNPEDYFILDSDRIEPVSPSLITHEAWTIEQSCTLDNFTKYPASRWNNGLIRLLGATDAAIIGEPGSVIDGHDPYDPVGEEFYRGPQGISAINCTNLTLCGYTIRNTGNWAHRIADSRNVRAEKVTGLAGHDGFHINGCDQVRILGCTFKTGDDCIAGFDNTDVVVRDCFLNTACSGFRFAGTDVLIEKCTLRGPGEYGFRGALSKEDKIAGAPSGRAKRNNMLSFFTYYADGTHPIRRPAAKIRIVDCTSHGTDRYFHYNYGNEKWQRGQPLADISFIRVTATGLKLPLSAWGDPALPLSLTFKDCRLGFERPQKELIRGAHLGTVWIDNLEVRGVDGPLIRLWNEKAGTPQVSASGLKGVSAEVVPSSDVWSVRGI